MPVNAGHSQFTTRFRLPLFWQVQLIGWSGVALLLLPVKRLVYGSMEGSLLITAYQLPLTLLLTAVLRHLYRQTEPMGRSHRRTVLLVLAGCVSASSIDVLVSIPVNRYFHLYGPADITGISLYVFRTCIYVIWSLAYLLSRALLQSRQQAFGAAVAAEKHRLEILRYQLNPRFLAQSLVTIRQEIADRPVNARAMTMLLADYYQNTVRHSELGRPTTIGDEVALLRTYLEIERLHRSDTLNVQYDLDFSLLSQSLPPVLLLPLAEKAINEGGGTKDHPLQITITVQRAGENEVLLEVANSGRQTAGTFSPFADAAGPEISEIQACLNRYYPGRHRFALAQDSFRTRATLSLPLTEPV